MASFHQQLRLNHNRNRNSSSRSCRLSSGLVGRACFASIVVVVVGHICLWVQVMQQNQPNQMPSHYKSNTVRDVSKIQQQSPRKHARNNTDTKKSMQHQNLHDHNLENDDNDDPDAPLINRRPTHHACEGAAYDGIYHIAMTDILGGAGTALLQLVIGQLHYAERNRLKPWIHLINNISQVIYDPLIHGRRKVGNSVVQLRALTGRNATYLKRPGGHWRDARPGPPDATQPIRQETLQFAGTGIWEHYFAPVSDFVPGDTSCENKLYVTMDLYLITPGLHGYDDQSATRCWRYDYLPEYITQPHIPLTEWLEPQRQRAHRVMKQYIRFRPYLWKAAQRANPNCRLQDHNSCLGLHIRHSDKAAGRRQVLTAEFLPFAQAFVQAGGQHIYVATDSNKVLEEMEREWPYPVRSRIRRLGPKDMIRSNNQQAVFDVSAHSHHRTNQEALMEILALSQCQFLIHGLSAVSEASIWINLQLHNTSVNLEDPDHLTAASFEQLVRMVLRDEPDSVWPRPIQTNKWWETIDNRHHRHNHPNRGVEQQAGACTGYDGVLHIANVGTDSEAGAAFFTHILNQLLYADKYNLKPWIYLQLDNASHIYDAAAHHHENESLSFEMMNGMDVSLILDAKDSYLFYPGPPIIGERKLSRKSFTVKGNCLWEGYFEPVSDFAPGDTSCQGKPLVTMGERLVTPGLSAYCPWSVRAWRYDAVPDHLWKPAALSYQSWIEPMRRKAHEIMKKYYRFQPHVVRRADQVNPVDPNHPCLAIHIRVGDKGGQYRRKIKADQYLQFASAFIQAGGRHIYLATDSFKALQFIEKNFPGHVTKAIQTQGKYVTRTSKEYPTHMIDAHHRVNSETLVDILAMSKCKLLLHSFSTVSEAAIYINPDLHKYSVNLEDPNRISPEEFEAQARQLLSMTF